MGVTRRGFIGTAAGAALGAATSKAVLEGTSRLVALTTVAPRPPGGPETRLQSVCSECPTGCGTVVRSVGERAVFVGGDPDHPVSRGGLCPRGLASLQAHYHPDRLLQPRQRNDESGTLDTVTREEALGWLADELQALRNSGRPHRLGILHRAAGGALDNLIGRFLRTYGSPNDLQIPSQPTAIRSAWRLTHGETGPLGFDLGRAGMVVSFGAGLLDGGPAGGAHQSSYGELRRGQANRRGRLVHIEPRLSVTGSRADEWVRLRPGTEGVLALGFAHVLITERRYDEEFVGSHAQGFEPWTDDDGQSHLGFRDWVLENYYLSRVSQETGVPAETIIRLAREFPRNAPAVAIPGRSVALRRGGIWACWAVHCLNALLGSIGVDGGVLLPPSVPLAQGPPVAADEIAAAGVQRPKIGAVQGVEGTTEASPGSLASLLAAADWQEPPLDVLLVVECDPVALSPAPEQLRRALENIPLVVVCASQANETTPSADVLLPTPTALERWDLLTGPPFFPHAICSLRRPVTSPRGEGAHPGEMILGLARLLGDPVAASFPWDDYPTYLRASVDGLFDARRGDLFGPEIEEQWTRLMQGAGMWAPSYRTAAELWEQMGERGGWWDPVTYAGEWRRLLRTSSGRFDFSARPEHDQLYLPTEDEEYPLLLYPFEILALAHGEFVDMPFLRTLSGPYFDGPIDGWVEVNPEVAEEFGLEDGGRVRVESRHGAIEARLRVYEGLEVGVAAMPLGFGRTVGRWAAGWGANPLLLTAPLADPATGDLVEYETNVRITRA